MYTLMYAFLDTRINAYSHERVNQRTLVRRIVSSSSESHSFAKEAFNDLFVAWSSFDSNFDDTSC